MCAGAFPARRRGHTGNRPEDGASSGFFSALLGGTATAAHQVEGNNLNEVFLEAVRGDDFVGVQTYSRQRVGPTGPLPPEEGVEPR